MKKPFHQASLHIVWTHDEMTLCITAHYLSISITIPKQKHITTDKISTIMDELELTMVTIG